MRVIAPGSCILKTGPRHTASDGSIRVVCYHATKDRPEKAIMVKRTNRAIAALLAFVVACLIMAPAAAFAEERAVEVENHTVAQDWKATVSDIHIGGVDTPAAGTQLDDKAQVTTAENEEWDIPVLWVRDDLVIMPDTAKADEGRTYLPILAFFVPDSYALQGSDCKVTLAEDLAALFGTDEIVSVYSQGTGITYILPASLKDLFVHATDEPSATGDATEGIAETAQPTLVDIYCAQTARDALSDEDLAWLIDLVINRLEPQAVNLLIDRFPAFRAAADKGEIGTQIGLYIYYNKGDADGDPAHVIDAEGTLAYVDDRSVMVGGASYSSDNPWSGQSAQETAAPAMAAKRDVAEGRVNEADGALRVSKPIRMPFLTKAANKVDVTDSLPI